MNPRLPLLMTAVALGAGASASGAITLDPGTSYLVGTRPSGMAAADFDGDGDVDLATTTDGPDKVSFLMNDGTGAYTLGPIALLPSSSSPEDLKAADVDGDGDMDLVVILRDINQVAAVMNQGGMSFVLGATGSVGNNARGLGIGDMDGDGDIDATVGNRDDNTATVLRNTGGSFASTTIPSGAEPRGAAFGDFDADGDLDLVVSCHDDRTIRSYTNNGGVFTAAATLSTHPQTRPEGVTCADLDNDGDDDIAYANNGNGFEFASVFVASGTAAFTGPFNFATGGVDTGFVIAADLDCDGLMDLITANQSSNTVSSLANLGGGAFGAPVISSVGAGPSEVATGDIDGDGDADIASANRDSNDVTVIRNASCKATVPGDVDGDGAVGVSDLLIVLSDWGACPGCASDLDGDGMVGVSDLLQVLANWS